MDASARASRRAVLSIAIAIVCAPSARADGPAAADAAPVAPRLFVRAAAGIGGIGLHPLGGRVDRVAASASGVYVEGLAGVPLGSFVLGGSLDAFVATRARVRTDDDETVRRVDRALVVFTAGPVLVWSPWGGPAGLAVGAGPRAFWVPAQPAWGDVARLPSQVGAGAIVQIGQAWALQGGGVLGAIARVGWGTTLRDDTGITAYQLLQLTLGASVALP